MAATCFAGVLLIGPLAGSVLASYCRRSICCARRCRQLDVLQGSDDPHLSLTAADDATGETRCRVIAMRFAAPIFFGNAQTLSAAIRQRRCTGPPPGVGRSSSTWRVTDVDVTGALAKELQWLRARGITSALFAASPAAAPTSDVFRRPAASIATSRATVSGAAPA